MTLREVLHAHIPTLTLASTVRDAIDKMDLYQFPALVVVDEETRPIAVITEGDLARVALQNGNLASLSKQPAHLYATQDPQTAHIDSEIGEALHLMLMRGLTLLPVIDENRLRGIVLRVDLMQAILTDLAS